MTTYSTENWERICLLAGVWKRGEKCADEYESAGGRDIPCICGAPKFGEWKHDIPPPDQSDPKVRAWVALECLQVLHEKGARLVMTNCPKHDYNQYVVSTGYIWELSIEQLQPRELNRVGEGKTHIDAIFATTLAYLAAEKEPSK